jgi:cytochrome c6
VTNGKNAMPAFGGRLSEADIANVATYVITTSEEGWE